MKQLPTTNKGWWHSTRFTELEVMERFKIKYYEWEEMGQTEEGQYAQAELIEYVAEKGQMAAWERHEQEEEYRRLFPPKQ